jgi:tetratricopeptide (TPR) repeat protein
VAVLEPNEAKRLELLGRAAWASTLVFRAENTEQRTRTGAARVKHQRESLLEHIKLVKRWLTQQHPTDNGDARVTLALNQARATVDNAYGRVLFLLGRLDDARDAVQRALVVLPDLGDAYVNMASISMAKPRRPGWEDDADEHLARALEISPEDERALMLRGELYADAAVRRYTDAAESFRRLPGDPVACFRLGELLLREGKRLEAVEEFSRSLSQDPTPDHRADRFVEAVLELNKAEPVAKERLEEALMSAKRLAKHGASARLKKKGEDLVARVEAAFAQRP